MSAADGGQRVLLRDDGTVVLDADGAVVLTRADDEPCVCCPPVTPPPPPICWPEYMRPVGVPQTTTGGTLVAAGIVMCTACTSLLNAPYQRWKNGSPNGTFTFGVNSTFFAGQGVYETFDTVSYVPPSESSGGGCVGPDLQCGNCKLGETSDTDGGWELHCIDEATKRWSCVYVMGGQHIGFYGEGTVVEPGGGAAAYIDFTNMVAACFDLSALYYVAYGGWTIATGGTVHYTFPPPP
jgi:hypothetical protein